VKTPRAREREAYDLLQSALAAVGGSFMRDGSALVRTRAEQGPDGDSKKAVNRSGKSPGNSARSGARGRLLFPAVALAVVGAAAATGIALAPRHHPAPAPNARAANIPASRSDVPDEEMTPGQPTVVSVRRGPTGTVLVGDRGLTLYVFGADRPGVSRCTGACAGSWLPAVTHAGKPRGSALVPAAMIGTILRGDGTYQVTFGRRPLYYYAGDRRAGDARGQGRTQFGGAWHVATLDDKS
jgi:predicted lipoprotein with Yx(FWY)xxD motif